MYITSASHESTIIWMPRSVWITYSTVQYGLRYFRPALENSKSSWHTVSDTFRADNIMYVSIDGGLD